MNDDVGEGIFMFKRTKMVRGKETSVYYNKKTDMTIEQMKSKHKWIGNYWKIGLVHYFTSYINLYSDMVKFKIFEFLTQFFSFLIL